MSGRCSRSASSAISSVARRVPITHALASSAIVPTGSYPSPHILINGVIFPNAPFSVAHSTPSMPSSPRPRRTPGKNALRRPIMAIIQRPASRQARRGERRDKGMACGSAHRLTHRASYPSPSRRILSAGAFHPGEAAIHGAYIPRRFPQLISSAPAHRLIRLTARRPIPAGKQAGKARRRAVIGGSRPSHRIPASACHRPRLAPHVGVRGERRLVPVGSVPSSCSCVSASFAVVKTFQSFLAPCPQPSRQASRTGRSVSVSSLVSAGGKPSVNAPVSVFMAPSIGTAGKQASKQDGSSRLIRLAPRVGWRGGLIRLAASPRSLGSRNGTRERRFG